MYILCINIALKLVKNADNINKTYAILSCDVMAPFCRLRVKKFVKKYTQA